MAVERKSKGPNTKEGGKELQGEERFFIREEKFWEENTTQSLFIKQLHYVILIILCDAPSPPSSGPKSKFNDAVIQDT